MLAVSDTLSIARSSDAMCLVFRAGKSPRGAGERAIKLLADLGRRPCGIVFNHLAPTGNGNNYHLYYGHYGRKNGVSQPAGKQPAV